MGTFHDGRGEYHGITVVVDTDGPEMWVGRCDTMDDVRIVLFDAERHDGADGSTKEKWLGRVAMAGYFPRHGRVVLPLEHVTSVKRLGEIEA